MKCQWNASPHRSCFASRSWRRFSPTISTPASASTASSSAVTYFVATTIAHAGPDLLADAGVAFSRSRSADNSRSPPAGRSTPLSRRWEKKSSGSQAVQCGLRSISVDARLARAPARRRRGRSRLPAAHDLVAEARAERRGDLLPHLVAARADPRADGGGDLRRRARRRRSARSRPAARATRRGARRAAGPVRPAERDRQAVGRHEHHRLAGLVGPEAVAAGIEFRAAQDAERLRLRHVRAVHLVAPSCPRSDRRQRPSAQSASGSRDPFAGSSSVMSAEVERAYGPSLTPPSGSRMRPDTPPGRLPLEAAFILRRS